MKEIYIFSGLGVGHRVFESIDFGNLPIHHIAWIEPLKKEDIRDYAQRISEKIKSNKPILIGLSFGGILAVEIAKIKPVDKIILIASAKNKNELPILYSYLGKLKINYLIPSYLLKKQNFIINWLFGIQSSSEKKLLKNILKDTHVPFLKWAINEILNWKNKEVLKNIIHIHGSSDRIIPIKNIKADYIIANGGHFMTVSKPKEFEKIIHELCSS